MRRTSVPICTFAAVVAVFAAGCGPSPSASPQRHASTHHGTSQTQSPTQSSSTQASKGSGTGQAIATPTTGGSTAASGPTVSFRIMPGGTAQAPAANLGISGLPKGWELTRMALVAKSGLTVSNTVQEAMTGSFAQSRGAFSMGADGQIITFFFPSPAGDWSGQTVRFVFTFRTAAGQLQTASSSAFPFPQ